MASERIGNVQYLGSSLVDVPDPYHADAGRRLVAIVGVVVAVFVVVVLVFDKLVLLFHGQLVLFSEGEQRDESANQSELLPRRRRGVQRGPQSLEEQGGDTAGLEWHEME